MFETEPLAIRNNKCIVRGIFIAKRTTKFYLWPARLNGTIVKLEFRRDTSKVMYGNVDSWCETQAI